MSSNDLNNNWIFD